MKLSQIHRVREKERERESEDIYVLLVVSADGRLVCPSDNAV